MSLTTALYPGTEQQNTVVGETGAGSKDTKEEIGNLFRLSECLTETNIYVSASKSYIDSSKKSIKRIKDIIIHAESDLNTAEECISMSEMKMKTLKQELQVMFNRSFYQNLGSDSEALSTKKTNEGGTPAAVESFDRSLQILPLHCQKFAEESTIDLNSYKVSDQYGGSNFISMHPKNRQTTPGVVNTSMGASNFHQNNRNLENLTSENECMLFGNVYQPQYYQNCEDFRNVTNRQCAHPYEKSRVTSEQNLSSDKLGGLSENLESRLFGNQPRNPRKFTPVEMKDSRMKTTGSSISSIIQANEAQWSRKTGYSSHEEEELVKIDSSDSESNFTSARRQKASEDLCEKRMSDDLIKMSSSSSSETFSQFLKEIDNVNNKTKSYAGHEAKTEVNETKTSHAVRNKPATGTGRFLSSDDAHASHMNAYNENLMKAAAVLLPQLNEQPQVAACRPKTHSPYTKNKACFPNSTASHNISELLISRSKSSNKKMKASLNSQPLNDLNTGKVTTERQSCTEAFNNNPPNEFNAAESLDVANTNKFSSSKADVYNFLNKTKLTTVRNNSRRNVAIDLSSSGSTVEMSSFNTMRINALGRGGRSIPGKTDYFNYSSVNRNDESTSDSSYRTGDANFPSSLFTCKSNSSKSPSYVPLTDKVTYPNRSIDYHYKNLPDSDFAHSSTEIDTSFDIHVDETSGNRFHGNESFPSGNAYANTPISMDTLGASAKAESRGTLDETFSESFQEDFAKSRTFGRLPCIRESADSFETVDESADYQ